MSTVIIIYLLVCLFIYFALDGCGFSELLYVLFSVGFSLILLVIDYFWGRLFSGCNFPVVSVLLQ